MSPMNDKLFLAIARKLGFPAPEAIQKLRAEHRGKPLHQAAVETGALAGDEKARFEKIAAKFTRGDRAVIQPSGSNADVDRSARKRRTLRQSSMTVATLDPSALAGSVAPLSGPRGAKGSTPSAGKVDASAARSGTPSAGKVDASAARSGTPSGAKVPRQGSAVEASGSGSKVPRQGSAVEASGSGSKVETRGSAARVPARTPSAKVDASDPNASARRAGGSASRVPRAGARAPGAVSPLVYLAGSGLLVLGSVVVALAIVFHGPTPQPGAGPSPLAGGPSPAASPVAAAPTPAPEATLTPASPERIAMTRAGRAVREAEELELEGREEDAAALLEFGTEGLTDPEARSFVTAAHERLLGRLRARVGEIQALSDEGKPARARKLLASFRNRFPPVLAPELDAAEAAISSAPGHGAASPAPASEGPSESQLAGLAKIHHWVTQVLRELQADSAARYFATLPAVEDPVLVAGLALDRKRIDGVDRLTKAASAGAKILVGAAVKLELRTGRAVEGKLARVDGTSLGVTASGGEVEVELAQLLPKTLFALADRGASDAEGLALGEGVLLACVGDRAGALATLAKSPEAALLSKAVAEDPDFLGPEIVTTPSVDSGGGGGNGGSVDDPGPSTVSAPLRPPLATPRPRPADQKPLTPAERKAALEAEKKKGGWKYALSSKYYDFFSNGSPDEVLQLATSMDLLCEEYKRVFGYKQPLPRPFPIWLYGDQAEFMRETKSPRTYGGFYDGEKIVAFHGKWSLPLETVLFHEGTHQFQGLVLGENLWKAPNWFVEGLAVYFESSELQGKRLVTDVIPLERLRSLKRDLHDTESPPLHLRDLLKLERGPKFGGREYGYAWSLIYFLCHGTNGGLERFKKYFEGIKDGKEPTKLFEELFDRPIEQIEDYWKDWILNKLK